MSADWVLTSQALPPEGRKIEFVLDHRDMAMSGTYRGSVFVSRWSRYDIDVVREWRPVADLEATAIMNRPAG